MRRRRISRSFRARAGDEQGFTIVEVLLAMMIMSIALVSLAYTANIAFAASARARRVANATQVGNQAVQLITSLPKGPGCASTPSACGILDGLYSGDVTISGDSHISGGKCVNTTAATVPCNGETLIMNATAATPLNPHKYTKVVGPTTYSVYSYVSWYNNSINGNLVRLTVVVTYNDLSAGTATKSFSLLYDQALGTFTATPESLTGNGSTGGGNLAIAGDPNALSSGSGTFDSAKITLPGLSAGVTSNPVTASASAASLLVQMNISGAATQCGGVLYSAQASSSNNLSSAPLSASGTYCDGTAPSGSNLAAPSTTPTTATYLQMLKGAVDSPATAQATAIYNPSTAGSSLCDATPDAVPCAVATNQGLGLGAGTANRYAEALVNLMPASVTAGPCPLIRVFDPNGGTGDASSVKVNRTNTDASHNNTTVTVTKKLPAISVGCFPAGLTVGSTTADLGGGTTVGSTTADLAAGGTTTVGSTTADLDGTTTLGNTSVPPDASVGTTNTFGAGSTFTFTCGATPVTYTDFMLRVGDQLRLGTTSAGQQVTVTALSSTTCASVGATLQVTVTPALTAISGSGKTVYDKTRTLLVVDQSTSGQTPLTTPVPAGTALTVFGGETTSVCTSSLTGCVSSQPMPLVCAGCVGYMLTNRTALGSTQDNKAVTYVRTHVFVNVSAPVASGTVITIGAETMTITACSPNCTSPGTIDYTVTRGAPAFHASGSTVTYSATVPTHVLVNVSTPVANNTAITIGAETMTITACSPNCTSPGTIDYTVTRGAPAFHASGSTVHAGTVPTHVFVNVSAPVASGTVITIGTESMTITGCSPGCTSTGTIDYTVTRGANGTTITSHGSGSGVEFGWVPTSYTVNGTARTWNRSDFDNPPALAGWLGGGFLVRLRGVVETMIASAGPGATSPTYARTGYVDYWDGNGYQTVGLDNSSKSINLPALAWGSGSGSSLTAMCEGAEGTPTALTSAPAATAYAFTVPAGSAPAPTGSSPITAAAAYGSQNMLPPSMYLRMSNSSSCAVAGAASNRVAYLNIAPNTGTSLAEAAYVPGP